MTSECNVIFFGQTGTGKSSAINLILGTPALSVSNDARPCTKDVTFREVTLRGNKYKLWDTCGLGEAKNIFQRIIFGDRSKKDLKKFLKERYQKTEIDLLVFCVHASRVTKAQLGYYKNFCVPARRFAVPIAIMVTKLERVDDMDSWWDANSVHLSKLEMDFDDHVCITTLLNHPRSAESKEKLIELITRNNCWVAKEGGSYCGSRVSEPTPSMQLPQGPVASSNEDPSFHTASEFPRGSMPSTPIIESGTSRSAATLELSRIQTGSDLPEEGSHRSQSPNDDTSGTMSPFSYPNYQSSSTSRSEGHAPTGTEDNENEPLVEFESQYVKRRKNYPTKRGNFGDIWECELILPDQSPRMVAVKALRINATQDIQHLQKKLRRELKVWAGLQHKNVVPLLGVVHGFSPFLSMVSPWLCNGSLSRFLANNLNLETSQKDHLLEDIATGLCYLHSRKVIHGDLHSDNILIDEHETACLTDFGLSFTDAFMGTPYLKSNICGIVDFTDPALVQRANGSSEGVYPTKPCDVYSFGGVMLHIVSGKKPYDGINAGKTFLAVMGGERPQISHDTSIPPWYRSKILMCWDEDERERPLAEDLLKMFGQQK